MDWTCLLMNKRNVLFASISNSLFDIFHLRYTGEKKHTLFKEQLSTMCLHCISLILILRLCHTTAKRKSFFFDKTLKTMQVGTWRDGFFLVCVAESSGDLHLLQLGLLVSSCSAAVRWVDNEYVEGAPVPCLYQNGHTNFCFTIWKTHLWDC